MAFSTAGSSGIPGGNAQRETGTPLVDVGVEVRKTPWGDITAITNIIKSLGFKTFSGDTKVRLLKTPWPADNPPISTASLFSISSKRGLVAAAGPDALIISETKHVRSAFEFVVDDQGNKAEVKDDVIPFDWNAQRQPLSISIDVPRLSHVAFTSNGDYLVICAESGGGLAVFDTSKIQNKQPAFFIGTDNTSIRSLAPNPAPELAHLIAVVLSNGHLRIANLEEKIFVNVSQQTTIIKDGVSCVSWSVKGKQLVAGLADGTAYQLDTLGAPKAIVPQPPSVGPDHHGGLLLYPPTVYTVN